MPGIIVTRRDLDFLFHQLCSTTAVLGYLFRVADLPTVALGEEPVRYYELAAADLDAPPGAIDFGIFGPGAQVTSVPQLPQAPAGDDDSQAHHMIRIILEDLANSPLQEPITEADRLTVLHDVDRLPVSTRAEWGHLLLEMLDDVPHVPDGHCKWRFRRHLNDDGMRQLIFGAATRYAPDIQGSFSAYVQLRHHEVTERTGGAEEASTLGVLFTPRHDGYRPWDTTMVRTYGPSQLTDEELQLFDETWNHSGGDLADETSTLPQPRQHGPGIAPDSA